jgi:outer membrane protein, multidrug efflux system
MRRFVGLLAMFVMTGVMTGCLVGPKYKRPAVNPPGVYRGTLAPDIQTSAANSTPPPTPLGAEKWANVFTDPVLQSLIAEALKNNFDGKIAADRVLEQQAQVGITRAGQLPTVSIGATTDEIGLPNSLNGSGTQSARTYPASLTTSVAWNLDFWGYYRRQTEAARAYLRATEWGQQTTYSTIVESVATSYFELRTLDAELDITRQARTARQESLRLTQTLEQGGANSMVDVREAEQLLYTAQAQIPDLERQIEQQENNLSILLGRSPGPIARGQPVADAPHPEAIPVGLPSELLERRPDIRRAEELLVQANANIGVARAQFFPQLSLSGTAGTASYQLKGLVDSSNFYYYAVGTLTQPIFEGGKLRNNLRLAKANDQELLDTYQQTITGALRDVSNALIAYNKTREYHQQQTKLVESAADGLRLARMRYNAGTTSYLEVLTSDSNLYTDELTLRTAEQQQALALVQLYNALGGGW